ncbi:hypothetical protein [Curtobacterium sp. MCPF17_052]|uniref:hypothetical protein n=1 Tax=Curtobacterium sp. MCPF17_052 TaxID=2175655 RepID=UPI003463F991
MADCTADQATSAVSGPIDAASSTRGDAPDPDAAVCLRQEGEDDGAEVAVGDDHLGAVGQGFGDDGGHHRGLRSGGDPRCRDVDQVREERAPLLDEGAVVGRRGLGA